MFSILNSLKGKQLKTRLLNPRDQFFDLLLGVNTFGYKHYSDNRKDPVWKGDYEPCRYKDLFKLLRHADVGPETVFVDFGCGLGRAVFGANHLKASKSIGVEFDKDLYQGAETNRLKSKPLDNMNRPRCSRHF